MLPRATGCVALSVQPVVADRGLAGFLNMTVAARRTPGAVTFEEEGTVVADLCAKSTEREHARTQGQGQGQCDSGSTRTAQLVQQKVSTGMGAVCTKRDGERR